MQAFLTEAGQNTQLYGARPYLLHQREHATAAGKASLARLSVIGALRKQIFMLDCNALHIH